MSATRCACLLFSILASAPYSLAQEPVSVRIGGKGVVFNAPTLGDLDGIPANGSEIAITGSDALVHAFRGDGSAMWAATLPRNGCSANRAGSTPAIGAIRGDGRPYVVTGYGGLGTGTCGGGVTALDGPTGSQAWNFDLRAFDLARKFVNPVGYSVFSSPALGDMNGDGTLEIGVGSFDRHAYLLSSTGAVLWFYQLGDTTWSSGAFADLAGTGRLEFVIGSDLSGNRDIKTNDGGYLNVFKSRTRRHRSPFAFRSRRILLWQRYLDQVVMSSPAIGDLIPDAPGLEIAVQSGCVFPQQSSAKRGNWVTVVSGATGQILRTLTTASCSASSPAIGDINSDGLLDIAAFVQTYAREPSHLVAWTPATGSLLWDIIPKDARGRNDRAPNTFLSPTIADLDGNGSPEVILPNARGVGIYNGADGRTLAVLPVPETLQSSAAVGDITGSGRPSLVAARKSLYIWSDFNGLGSDPGSQRAHTAPWAMFRSNAEHTGMVNG